MSGEIGYEVEQWAEELLANIERNLSKFVEAADYGRRRLHERSSKESASPTRRPTAPTTRRPAKPPSR